MSSISYIGSKISLTSKSGNRYEGILKAVDPITSTITLSQVRVFGTEGRRPGAEVPSSQEVYAEVSFKSTDIEDLRVFEKQPPATEQPKSMLPADPAIVSSRVSEATPAKATAATPVTPMAPRKPPAATAAATTPETASKFAASNAVKDNQAQPKPAPTFSPPAASATRKVLSYSTGTGQKQVIEKAPQQPGGARSYASAVGFSHVQQQSRQQPQQHHQSRQQPQQYHQRSHAPRPAAQPVVIPSTDFDFASSNAKLTFDDLVQTEAAASKIFYNKAKSFFDEISGVGADRQALYEDRRVNMETFGQTSLPQQYPHGSPSRRGNNRGGYRGGYPQQPQRGGLYSSRGGRPPAAASAPTSE